MDHRQRNRLALSQSANRPVVCLSRRKPVQYLPRNVAAKYGPVLRRVSPVHALAAVLAPFMFSPANAVIDVSAITAGISEAGVALLAVIGGLLALSVSIFGISKVYSFVKRKAGA